METFIIAGTSRLERRKVIEKHVRKGALLRLNREPNNPRDATAIAVYLKARWGLYKKIGYVNIDYETKRDLNVHLREGGKVSAEVADFTLGEFPRVEVRFSYI